jgi:regulator of cell morphogenesis and NO signaling
MQSIKIGDIVQADYKTAAVLHEFGLPFYLYTAHTLAEACQARGLNIAQVVRSLESVGKVQSPALTWQEYPIEVIIHYLRLTHKLFIQEKLPYMASLIQNLEILPAHQTLVKDLQWLFPLFQEDFTKHIQEEEDSLFRYILTLLQAQQGTCKQGELYYQMQKYSIQFFALDHHTHDDEMRGIRELTNEYVLDKPENLHLKVIFEELKALERALIVHAQVEDEILFVKALRLEQQVKDIIATKSQWN